MQISVTCPQCQSTYQLDPSMRGKRMRCLNTICRTLFEIKVDGEAEAATRSSPTAPPPGAVGRVHSLQTGSVGDMIQVLPAALEEAPAPAAMAEAPAAPTALAPPPVRQVVPLPSDVPTPPAPEPSSDFDFPGDPDLPESDDASQPSVGPRELAPGNWDAPPVRHGDANNVMPSFAPTEAVQTPTAPTVATEAPKPTKSGRRSLVLIAIMLIVLGGLAGGGFLLVRGSQAGREAERSQKAQQLYDNQDFAEAAEAFRKLYADYPTSRNRAQYDFMRELASARDSVAPHVNVEEDVQAWDNVKQFLERFKNDPILKDRHGDVWQMLHTLAKQFAAVAEEKQDPGLLDLSRAIWAQASKFQPPAGVAVRDVEQKLAAEFSRVEKAIAKTTQRLEALESLRRLVSAPSAAAVQKGRDSAAKAGLTTDPEAKKIVKELVAAHRASVVFVPANPYEKQKPIAEDDVASVYVAPALGKSIGAPTRSGVVLAQVSGVLHALEPSRGEVRWVRRVGVDTSILPLHVPATALLPERYLVLSSDSTSLTAVEAETGVVLWQTGLSDVCLGQPVLIDQHVFVPTRAGRVEEIEIREGRLQGHYQIGQPLMVGGVRQPGTSLVYFPADSFCVYVLDVAKRACAAVLYTGHAPGSLRTLPAIWNEEKTAAESPAIRMGWMLLGLSRGGTSEEFVPYALPITDPDQKPSEPTVRSIGTSWFDSWRDGEKLAWATDAGYLALYGLRQKGNRDPLLFPMLSGDYMVTGVGEPGRAQVVHVDAENYWVLSRGRLHRLQATFTAQNGPGLVARGPQPPILGSPLHAAQVYADANGNTTLFVTTQASGKPITLVSAIAAETGQILWQRQLGLICQGPLIVSGNLVACSDAGGMFLFDARKLIAEPIQPWQAAGNFVPREHASSEQQLFAHKNGIVRISWTRGPAPDLRISHWNEMGEPQEEFTFNLPATPHGTLALGKDFALLPLANGVAARVPLGTGNIANGRIVSAPAVVAKGQIVVADASDTVTLLDADHLQPIKRWTLPGKITAGPFVRQGRIGCVVGKFQLVWLDPTQDKPLWEKARDAEIVGEPQLIDGLLVVADLAGRVQALDPATGEPVGPGYTIRANAPPSAAPVSFGAGRMLLPLMDGTAMLLPLDKVKGL
ncbi:MAG: PQQ-binding-like beta-propeller repeat protein [Planctomycetes bacterium]|nr:PQQ-binding-like beta-propeller repeat protein [Planctomycetota bacterium]